jgi:hypothetical protein
VPPESAILKHFLFNLPSYPKLLSPQIFNQHIAPLIPKLMDLVTSNQDLQSPLYVVLPQTIVEIKSDQTRTEIINKLDEAFNKAIEDKNIDCCSVIIRELDKIYKEYSSNQGDEIK